MSRTALFRVLTFVISGLAVVSAAPAHAQAMERVPYPEDGVRLKTGWNSIKQQKMLAACVVAGTAKDASEKRDVKFREVRDTSSLMRFLSVSAKAKAKVILGGSFSASASFANTVDLKRDSVHYAVDAHVTHGVEYVVPPGLETSLRAETPGERASQLKKLRDAGANTLGVLQVAQPEAAENAEGDIMLRADLVQLAAKNLLEFRRRCGDGFVSAIYKTSGINGMYSFNTRTEKEKTDVRVAISGSGGPWSASASAQQVKDSFVSQGRLSISYTQLGGAGTPFAIDDAGLRKLIERIGENPAGAVPTHITVTAYEALPNFPQPTSAASKAIDQIAEHYFRLMTHFRHLGGEDWAGRWVQMPPRDVPGWENIVVAPSNARKLQDEVLADMRKLKAALEECVLDESTCAVPDGVSLDDYGFLSRMPILRDDLHGFAVSTNNVVAHRVNEQWAIARHHLSGTPPCDQLRPANRRMLEAFWKYHLDLERAQFFHNIRDVAKARCDDVEPLCLSNAEIDAWKARLLSDPNKPPPFDVYGCETTPWIRPRSN